MPESLDPIATWSDHEAYLVSATALAKRFKEAFAQFEDEASPALLQAGPR